MIQPHFRNICCEQKLAFFARRLQKAVSCRLRTLRLCPSLQICCVALLVLRLVSLASVSRQDEASLVSDAVVIHKQQTEFRKKNNASGSLVRSCIGGLCVCRRRESDESGWR